MKLSNVQILLCHVFLFEVYSVSRKLSCSLLFFDLDFFERALCPYSFIYSWADSCFLMASVGFV